MVEMPTEQRRLLIQFDLYLRFVHQIASTVSFGGSIGYRIPYAIFVSLVNRARAVSALFASGYVQEADPIVRSMINATANFLFIVGRPDPDGFALMYYLHIEDLALFRTTRLEEAGMVDAARADRMKDEIRQAAAPHRAAAEAAGMSIPPKPGSKKDTWTGLSDEQLMKEVGADRWYASYYRHLSSGVHADASTIGPDILALVNGVAAVGPRYREPLAAVRVSVEVMHGAVLGFRKHFGAGDLRLIDQAKSAIDHAIQEYIEGAGLGVS
ncbi:MAG TPA: DUF5677 domain-containing protein [Candidatus Micrarchaeaceae archaeon]|nr:DUF5677 domain-containing protein [Candidatus Micrarchaeaceae archaeon]